MCAISLAEFSRTLSRVLLKNIGEHMYWTFLIHFLLNYSNV
jgi:hypothetical protein